MKISILGTGNLGSSIASGLLEKNMITQLFLTKKNLSTLNKQEKVPEIKITTNNSNAVKNSDIIIICVQPSQFENLANEIKNYLTDRHTIISTITGLSINKIEKIFGVKTNIIRAMPNTAISIGKSTTCICNNKYGKYKFNNT